MSTFTIGQRWISEPEPELGLGTVIESGDGRVQMLYPATGEVRVYTEENAPLRRVTFRVGETIEDHEGNSRTIDAIDETAGVLTYRGADWELPEAQLNDRLSVHGPIDRLRGGHVDDAAVFALRRRARLPRRGLGIARGAAQRSPQRAWPDGSPARWTCG